MVESSEANGSLRLERLERIYEENPGTRLFLALAEEYFRDGQLEKAVEVCQGGLEIFPGYTSARVTLARSLIDLGQDARAEEELGAVLGNSPDNLLASRLYAALLIRQDRFDEAGTVVERLLELSPDDEDGLRFRDQLEHSGEPQAEPAAGSRGEQIKTSTLARLYEEQGLHEKALGVYDTLLSMNPDNQEIAHRAAALRSRLAEETAGSSGDAAAPERGRRIERLGRLLDAARALSPDRSASD